MSKLSLVAIMLLFTVGITGCSHETTSEETPKENTETTTKEAETESKSEENTEKTADTKNTEKNEDLATEADTLLEDEKALDSELDALEDLDF